MNISYFACNKENPYTLLHCNILNHREEERGAGEGRDRQTDWQTDRQTDRQTK